MYGIRVVPRYTPGSPATVDRDLGLQVAAEERRAHERRLTGRYGIEAKEEAEKLGLVGIAVENIHPREVGARISRGTRWYRDVLTGESYSRKVSA